MRGDECWAYVEQARERAGADGENDVDVIAEELTELLTARPLEDIIAFAVWQQEREDESYRWDLWGAAYLINGGCSDDGFDYFRGWLLAQGEKVWRAALAEPDSLADVPAVRTLAPGGENEFASLESEAMLGAASSAYAAVAVVDEDDCEALDTFYQAVGERITEGPASEGPLGEDWDFDDEEELRRRLPRLSALFSED